MLYNKLKIIRDHENTPASDIWPIFLTKMSTLLFLLNSETPWRHQKQHSMNCSFVHACCGKTVAENEIFHVNIGQNIKFSDPWELYTSKESLENVQFKFITKKSSFEIFDWPFNVKIVKKVIFCFSKISKTNSKKGLLWDQSWTSVLPGHISYWHFWQVFPYKEFQKTVLISFDHL